MTIQDVGSIGELIAAIATVATLAYLAIQIRQNTRALEAASRRDVVSTSNQLVEILTRDDVGPAYALALRTYPNVSPEQKRRFWRGLDFFINSIQEAFALYESGSLDRDVYEMSLAGLAAHLVTPGGSAFWNEHRDFLPSNFKETVEQRTARGHLPDILAHPYFQIVEPETTAAQQGAGADSTSTGA